MNYVFFAAWTPNRISATAGLTESKPFEASRYAYKVHSITRYRTWVRSCRVRCGQPSRSRPEEPRCNSDRSDPGCRQRDLRCDQNTA